MAPVSRPLLLLLVCLALIGCHRPVAAPAIPTLTREAYVWQQVSSPALDDAVRQALPELSSLSFHAADIRLDRTNARVKKFPIPWTILAQDPRPVSLVIRLHAAELNASAANLEPTRDLIHDLLADTQKAGLTCREVQLDYDCAEKNLRPYREFLTALRAAVPEVPLPITALPSWLKHPEFRPLAEVSDHYILQVHSLTLPERNSTSVTLFDPVAARAAIDQAVAIGRPFRLALPTYRSTVVMDVKGKRGCVYSENLPPPLEGSQYYISGQAEPAVLAPFVAGLQASHSPLLTGLIWYRLPVSTDRMNWPWSTFQLVSQGRVPKSQLTSSLDLRPEGFSTIVISNTGEQPEPAPLCVVARSADPNITAADALGGYVLQNRPGARLFVQAMERPPLILAPGTSLTVGWIRLTPGESATISLE